MSSCLNVSKNTMLRAAHQSDHDSAVISARIHFVVVCQSSTQCCGSKYIELGSRIWAQLTIILEKTIVLNYSIRTNMSPKEIFSQLWTCVSEFWIYILNLTPFASILPYIYICGFGSASVFGLRNNTDPQCSLIRIQYVSGLCCGFGWILQPLNFHLAMPNYVGTQPTSPQSQF